MTDDGSLIFEKKSKLFFFKSQDLGLSCYLKNRNQQLFKNSKNHPTPILNCQN
jgi:hypothetical protein